MIAHLHGYKAAHRAAGGNTQVEKGRPPSRRGRVDTAAEIAVRSSPRTAGAFKCAIAEKTDEHRRNTGDAQQLGARFVMDSALPRGVALLAVRELFIAPQGQRQRDHHRDKHLDTTEHQKTQRPRGTVQALRHDDGARTGTHAPHAVKPTHVLRLVMNGNISVERRINRAGTEPIGNGEQHKLPKCLSLREPHKGRRGEHHARDRNPTRTKPLNHAYRHKAREDRAARDDHGDGAHPRDAGTQLRRHGGPGRPDGRIGQAKADER